MFDAFAARVKEHGWGKGAGVSETSGSTGGAWESATDCQAWRYHPVRAPTPWRHLL